MSLKTRLHRKIDTIEARLDKKIDGDEEKLIKKISAVEETLGKKRDAVSSNLAAYQADTEVNTKTYRVSDAKEYPENSVPASVWLRTTVRGPFIGRSGLQIFPSMSNSRTKESHKGPNPPVLRRDWTKKGRNVDIGFDLWFIELSP